MASKSLMSFNSVSILIPKCLKLGYKIHVNVPHNRMFLLFLSFGFLVGKRRHKIGGNISSSRYDQNDYIVRKMANIEGFKKSYLLILMLKISFLFDFEILLSNSCERYGYFSHTDNLTTYLDRQQ
jgi:hypothetical protein